MPFVSVVLAGLMMRSRGAIRLGMRIACRRTPTAIGFGGYSLWTADSRECGYSVRIQCVRLHDRAICTRGSPGPDKLESVCTGCHIHASHLSLSLSLSLCLCFTLMFSLTHTDTHTDTHTHTLKHTLKHRQTQTHRHTDTHTQTPTHTHTHTDTQTHRHTHTHTYTHTHTHTHTHLHTHTHTPFFIEWNSYPCIQPTTHVKWDVKYG